MRRISTKYMLAYKERHQIWYKLPIYRAIPRSETYKRMIKLKQYFIQFPVVAAFGKIPGGGAPPPGFLWGGGGKLDPAPRPNSAPLRTSISALICMSREVCVARQQCYYMNSKHHQPFSLLERKINSPFSTVHLNLPQFWTSYSLYRFLKAWTKSFILMYSSRLFSFRY